MTTTPIPATHEIRPTRVLVRTRRLDEVDDLLSLLPRPHGVLSWLRNGEGIIGWGQTARIDTRGPQRFAQAERDWRDLTRRMTIDDEVGLPGCGPVAFVSFAFANRPGHSVLIVPKIVVGRTRGTTWITEIDATGTQQQEAPTAAAVAPTLRWREGRLPAQRWHSLATEALRRIHAGELDKVVLARDLIAEADEPLDPRAVLRRLAARHPDCWTFAVDGWIGATPELLLRRQGHHVSSRVLAGSTWPGSDGEQDLLRSTGYREEHRHAVESLTASLRTHCTSMHVNGPTVLHLPHISHLCTGVTGTLDAAQPSSLLSLADSVHPTAAVGGTPRRDALRTIGDLEQRHGFERDRYAGPVGWVDVDGNGELGIALRCAHIAGHHARLFAGCGLVAGSNPDTELQEIEAKFAALREALGR